MSGDRFPTGSVLSSSLVLPMWELNAVSSPRYDVTVKGNMTQHVTWRSGDSNRRYGVCRKLTGVEGVSLVLTGRCRKPATKCRVIDGVRKERLMQGSRRSVRGYPSGIGD